MLIGSRVIIGLEETVCTGPDCLDNSLEMEGADAIGVNCSTGPDQLESVIRTLKNTCTLPIIAKPNAGMPKISDSGEAVYSMESGEFAQHMERLVEAGASLIGGCCGTTPEFIEALRGLKR